MEKSLFILVLLVFTKYINSNNHISLNIYFKNNNTLKDEIPLNFTDYIKYSKYISKKEFQYKYIFSDIEDKTTIKPFFKKVNLDVYFGININKKNTKNIYLHRSILSYDIIDIDDSFNIIILPKDKNEDIKYDEILLYFLDIKIFIFFVESKKYNDLQKYEINGGVYGRIYIPENISKDFHGYDNLFEFIFSMFCIIFSIYFFSYLKIGAEIFDNNMININKLNFFKNIISSSTIIRLAYFLYYYRKSSLLFTTRRGLISSYPNPLILFFIINSKYYYITGLIFIFEGILINENKNSKSKKKDLITIYKNISMFIYYILYMLNLYHILYISAELFIFHYFIYLAIIKYNELKRLYSIFSKLNKEYIPFIKERISLYIKQIIIIFPYFMIILGINLYNKYYTDNIIFEEYAYLKNELMIFSLENIYYIYFFSFINKPIHNENISFTQNFEISNLCDIYNKSFDIKYKRKQNKGPIVILNPKLYLMQKRKHNKINDKHNLFFIGYHQ